MFKEVIESLVKIFNEDAYLNLTVSSCLNMHNYSEHDAKLYTKLTYGVVENKLLIDYLLAPFITGKRVKPFMKNTLRVGVYAISYMNLGNHYVVNELVQLTKKKDYKGSTFVNAILRSYIKVNLEEKGLDKALLKLEQKPLLEKLSIKYSINLELVKLLNEQYLNLEEILKPNNDSYNYYRINTLKITPEDIKKILNELKIQYKINDVILKTKTSLIKTTLFKDGLIVAQDSSSIKVGLIASPKPNSKVLDVCSAPGAKSMHLAAMMNNTGSILSCDIYEHKLRLIEENALKLGVKNISTMLADGTSTKYPDLYDLVIVDVPCSGLGVINHKSDLKYKMTLAKIEEIKTLQIRILENASKYVKKQGTLVYSTCTINKQENELRIKEFLNQHKDYHLVQEISIVQNCNTQEDGFYICKLRRE